MGIMSHYWAQYLPGRHRHGTCVSTGTADAVSRRAVSVQCEFRSGAELKYRNGLAGFLGRGIHPPYPCSLTR